MARNLAFTLLGSVVVLAASMGPAWATPVEVPEPSSLALIALGVGSVAWIKFRNRK